MNTNRQFNEQSWRLLLAVIFTFSLIYPSVLFADSPSAINYQGKLADNAGNPLTGTYQMLFEIYANPSGGAALFSDDRRSTNLVPVNNGIFNVLIGTGSTLSGNLRTVIQGQGASSAYLQVTVGNPGTALLPRQRLVASPYALSVAADAITNTEVASGANITVSKLAAGTFTAGSYSFSGSSVTFSGSGMWGTTGKLGIGTTLPTQELHVVGDTIITGLGGSGNRMVTVDNNGLLSQTALPGGGTVGGTGAANRVAFWSDASNISSDSVFVWDTGRLGIGLSNPTFNLDVTGTTRMTNTLTFSGATTDITTVSGQDFAIMPNGVGQVGIGTTSPGYMLEIAGNLGLRSDGSNTGELKVAYEDSTPGPAGYYATYAP